MPTIEAMCLHDAFDSTQCLYYERGRTYPIDTESEVANMTVRPLSSGKVDPKTGEIIAVKVARKPMPVFEFDRAAPLGSSGNGVPNDYTCKKCGKECKSLNGLGTHNRQNHPLEVFKDGTEEEEIRVIPDARKTKAKTFTCKTCGEVLPNLWALRVHNKNHEEKVEAETDPVPA
jgi:hypothetical protein